MHFSFKIEIHKMKRLSYIYAYSYHKNNCGHKNVIHNKINFATY